MTAHRATAPAMPAAALRRIGPADWMAAVAAIVLFFPIGVVAASDLAAASRLGLDTTQGRIRRKKASRRLTQAVGIGSTIWVVGFVALIMLANDAALTRAFFDVEVIGRTLPTIAYGFMLNVRLFLVAEVFILIAGVLLALLRSLPGRPAILLRWLTTAYVDVFRGLPSILVILIVVYGLKRTQLPLLSGISDYWYVIIALTLHYSAYTAEVIKGGADGIHWSQAAAARSLGLTYFQSMRYVVLPQAMRRMLAPLLNYFIGLQKDTSLVAVIGLLDSVNRANVQSINEASLSPYTGVALCFLVVTIPLTRVADWLEKRRRRRELASG
ncbi:MAG: amino acid ABC transporter permease [Rhizobiales bacterium]|nr:amino acid ABC transporter permease [Hyphomicrobiales bacterium]